MERTSVYELMASRRKVKQGQKAWKFIRDLCSLDVSDMNKPAIIGGRKDYTYGNMFREWERYAAVFSALGMTEENHARVGILGSTSAEVIFSMYGLNMVGAQVSIAAAYLALNPTRVCETIVDEKLTDFIVTDDMAQPDLVKELLLRRKELGLRHVILLHVPMVGVTFHPMMTMAQEAKYASLKATYGPICMDTLLAAYGSRSVRYAQQETDDLAFIMHTSGTTSGIGKPIPLSDSAMNAAVARFFKVKDLALPSDQLVTATIVDLSNSYGIIDQVHLPLAIGAAVVAVPLGVLSPWFYKAISEHRISFLFSISAMFARWIKMPEDTEFDFSSLKFVALGGQMVSAADKKRYHAFITAHGGKDVTVLNGYGLSELGGACCLSTPDLDDEAIGFPLPGISILLHDEENDRFFTPQGEGGEGVLYMNSLSMATQQIDGVDAVKIEVFSRKPYVCTNDLVRVDGDGKITYLGRANRFFMRQEGRKYESGRVEAEFTRLECIESCAIVPVFEKHQHDNVPMLCVQTLTSAGKPMDVILKALQQVFIDEKTLSEDLIPFRVMLAETLPRNANGKVDLYKINKGDVAGETYTVEAVRADGQLTSFSLTPCEIRQADIIEELFDIMSSDIKGKTPGKKLMNTMKKERSVMENNNKMLEQFNAMANMHRQMMGNMFSMATQMFPGANKFASMFQSPEMQSMKEMMPTMETMMPQMEKAAKAMKGMVPDVPAMMKSMAEAVIPVIHKQTVMVLTNVDKMSQMAYETEQKINEYKREVEEKCFNMAMKMVTAEPKKKEEKPAEIEEAKAEETEVKENEGEAQDQDQNQ